MSPQLKTTEQQMTQCAANYMILGWRDAQQLNTYVGWCVFYSEMLITGCRL